MPGDSHLEGEVATAAPALQGERAELASLSGTLKVAGEDLPLPGVPLALEGGPTAVSDARGTFAFHGVTPGAHRLAVQSMEPFAAFQRELTLAPGANAVAVELEPRFSLYVSVWEALPPAEREGAPIPIRSAHVQLARPSLFEPPTEILGSGPTDANGSWALGYVAPGEYELLVEADGYRSERFALSKSFHDYLASQRGPPFWPRDGERARAWIEIERVELESSSTKDERLRGRITGPLRSAVEGALVCLHTHPNAAQDFSRIGPWKELSPAPPFTFSDAQGAFELPLAEGQSEVLLIVCPRQGDLSPIVWHAVPPEHLEREIAVQVPAARPFELRVLRADGSAARGLISVVDRGIDYDRRADPVLSTIPGFEDAFGALLDVERGSARLSLPDGAFGVRFDGEPGVLGSWFVHVHASTPDVIELRLP